MQMQAHWPTAETGQTEGGGEPLDLGHRQNGNIVSHADTRQTQVSKPDLERNSRIPGKSSHFLPGEDGVKWSQFQFVVIFILVKSVNSYRDISLFYFLGSP